MEKDTKTRIIISGGGTGGHIFPALSIAGAIRQLRPQADILFVGAEGRMEMQRVPDAGYPIVGLPVAGLDRKHLWKNVAVAWKLLRSQWMARKLIKEFRPQVAVGVGGYASGPTLKMAAQMGIPTLIQEQNSYAGVTNRLLARKARRICVAYEGMERFFPADRIQLTGNPVRQNLTEAPVDREEAACCFGLDARKKTVLVLGGSLGARTLNRTMCDGLPLIQQHPEVQFIWQTGKVYIDQVRQQLSAYTGEAVRNGRVQSMPNLYVTDFISRMPAAYAMAQLVVSRAGAGSIAELCLLGKPAVLVPSPNVAEDHQTKNAMALVQKQAARYLADSEAGEKLLPLVWQTVADDDALQQLARNIGQLARPDAAREIAIEVLRLADEGTDVKR